MIGSLIMKLTMKAVTQATGEIARQVTRVQSEVLETATNHVNTGFDDIWRGEDADAFKQKVLRIAVPQMQSIINFGGLNIKGVLEAAQKMQAADAKASSMIGDLGNVFGKIF